MTEPSVPDDFHWLEATDAQEERERREAQERDDQDWATARRLDTPAAYARYCRDHPDGRHLGEVPPQPPERLRALVLRGPGDSALRAFYLQRRSPDLEQLDRARDRRGRVLAGALIGLVFGALWATALPWLGWATLGVPLGGAVADVAERLLRWRANRAFGGPFYVALAALAGWGCTSGLVGPLGPTLALFAGVLLLCLLGALLGALGEILRNAAVEEIVVTAWLQSLRSGVGGAIGAAVVVALPYAAWAPLVGALVGGGGALISAHLAAPAALLLGVPLMGAGVMVPRDETRAGRWRARLWGAGMATLVLCVCAWMLPFILLIVLAPASLQPAVLQQLTKPLHLLWQALLRWAPAAALAATLATLLGMGGEEVAGVGAGAGLAAALAALGAPSAWLSAREPGQRADPGPLPWYAHFFSPESAEHLYR